MLRISLCILAGLAAVVAPAAEKTETAQRKIHLQWRDLGPMVTGHSVKLKLPGGKQLKGDVLAVEPEALVLDIKGTFDRHAWPKGERSIPKDLVSELRVIKKRGYTWRVVGTVLAGAAGAALGGVVAFANPGAGIATFAGVTSLGFWGGWISDRTITVITIDPGL
jgi:hypothetical protein